MLWHWQFLAASKLTLSLAPGTKGEIGCSHPSRKFSSRFYIPPKHCGFLWFLNLPLNLPWVRENWLSMYFWDVTASFWAYCCSWEKKGDPDMEWEDLNSIMVLLCRTQCYSIKTNQNQTLSKRRDLYVMEFWLLSSLLLTLILRTYKKRTNDWETLFKLFQGGGGSFLWFQIILSIKIGERKSSLVSAERIKPLPKFLFGTLGQSLHSGPQFPQL